MVQQKDAETVGSHLARLHLVGEARLAHTVAEDEGDELPVGLQELISNLALVAKLDHQAPPGVEVPTGEAQEGEGVQTQSL